MHSSLLATAHAVEMASRSHEEHARRKGGGGRTALVKRMRRQHRARRIRGNNMQRPFLIQGVDFAVSRHKRREAAAAQALRPVDASGVGISAR